MKRVIAGLFALSLWPGVGQAADYVFATEELAPFSYAKDGKAAGPLVEIVAAVCRALHKRCDINLLPWRRTTHLAETGEVQGVFPLLDTTERREIFYMSQPLIRSGYAIYTKEKSGFTYRSPSDIKDRTIGAYGPSGTSVTAQALITQSGSNGRMVIELSNENVLRELAGGRYGEDGLAMINEDTAADLIKSKGITGIEFAGEVKQIAYVIGFSKKGMGNEQRAAFNAELGKLIASGEAGRILAAHGLRGF